MLKAQNKGSGAAVLLAGRSFQAQEAGARMHNSARNQGWRKTQVLSVFSQRLSCRCLPVLTQEALRQALGAVFWGLAAGRLQLVTDNRPRAPRQV